MNLTPLFEQTKNQPHKWRDTVLTGLFSCCAAYCHWQLRLADKCQSSLTRSYALIQNVAVSTYLTFILKRWIQFNFSFHFKLYKKCTRVEKVYILDIYLTCSLFRLKFCFTILWCFFNAASSYTVLACIITIKRKFSIACHTASQCNVWCQFPY